MPDMRALKAELLGVVVDFMAATEAELVKEPPNTERARQLLKTTRILMDRYLVMAKDDLELGGQ